MTPETKNSLIQIAIAIIVILIVISCYMLFARINYAITYQSLVKDTVKEMVRPECLK